MRVYQDPDALVANAVRARLRKERHPGSGGVPRRVMSASCSHTRPQAIHGLLVAHPHTRDGARNS